MRRSLRSQAHATHAMMRFIIESRTVRGQLLAIFERSASSLRSPADLAQKSSRPLTPYGPGFYVSRARCSARSYLLARYARTPARVASRRHCSNRVTRASAIGRSAVRDAHQLTLADRSARKSSRYRSGFTLACYPGSSRSPATPMLFRRDAPRRVRP